MSYPNNRFLRDQILLLDYIVILSFKVNTSLRVNLWFYTTYDRQEHHKESAYPLNTNPRNTICIFSALYPPHIGGVENFTQALANELANQGYRVIVVTNNHDALPNRSYPQKNIVIYRLPCFSFLDARLPWPKKDAEFRQLMTELENEQIDHICINTRFYPHSLIGAQLARKKGLVPVVIEHGSDYLTLGNPLIDWGIRRYEHLITKRLKAYRPKFYAVSKRASEWLNTFGIQSQGEINNAINAQGFRTLRSTRDFRKELGIPESALLVAFVGRVTPEKGIEQLVEAAQLLSGRTDIQFAIAGDGALRDKLEKRSPSSVHFLGTVSREDLSALLQEAEVFCLPSRSEGFATTLLEAASCGAVPIITNFGGSDEMVPSSEFGVLLPDNKSETIAKALVEAGADHERLRARSNKIRLRAEKDYNWQEVAQTLIEALESAD